MGILIYLISTAIGLFLIYLVVKAAINHSVLADLYSESRHQSDVLSRELKALNSELQEMKRILNQREDSR